MDKKILIIVPSLTIGGRERIAINTVNVLKKDYEVKMIIFQDKTPHYNAACDVININSKADSTIIKKIINQIVRGYKIRKFRNQNSIDYVISFGSAANLANSISSFFSKGKTITAIHGFAEVKKSPILQLIIKKSDRVICISKAMQDHLLNLYPNCINSVVIQNGYELEKIDCSKKKKSGDVTFVAMGRLDYVKGFDRLIHAFKKLHSEVQNVSLKIVGEGEMRLQLEQQIQELKMTDYISLCGYSKNPNSLLIESDVFVLSSRNEGFPNALIEALNCNLPIIAVDCETGPREILSSKYINTPIQDIIYSDYGILIPNGSDESIIENLFLTMKEIALNVDLRTRYSLKGKSRANCFSIDVYEEKLYLLLNDCT